MSEKNQGEIVITSTDAEIAKKVSVATGLDVKMIGDTGYATTTIDALSLSPVAWQAFTQSPAMRSAVDLCKSADKLRSRLLTLRELSEKTAISFEHFGRLTAKEFAGMVLGHTWPRRSKPARRAMAKLAARRGKRG